MRLYYLRERSGKSARIKEKLVSKDRAAAGQQSARFGGVRRQSIAARWPGVEKRRAGSSRTALFFGSSQKTVEPWRTIA
ncbi:hypothetical protein [Burkholderia pseudomallei]|uniref:hypothetical protein n=1 Tax=Burkholderia pseudomallei TaxID=28450 RepID=UPI00387A3511